MSQCNKPESEVTPATAPSTSQLKKEWVYPEMEALPIEETKGGFDINDDGAFGYS
jgi:hypothetical protein